MDKDGKNLLELLRLASVAASEAAEAELDRLEVQERADLSTMPRASRYLRLSGPDSPIARLFVEEGARRELQEGEGEIFVIGDAYLIRWEDGELWLRLEYSRYEQEQDEVTGKAYEAARHVLASADADVTVETN